jgi:hypothetical protein
MPSCVSGNTSICHPRLRWWQEVAAPGEALRHEWQVLVVSDLQNHTHSGCQMVQEVTMEQPVTCITYNVKQTMWSFSASKLSVCCSQASKTGKIFSSLEYTCLRKTLFPVPHISLAMMFIYRRYEPVPWKLITLHSHKLVCVVFPYI